ncbi:NAD-dependent succinate-semialdehyde dehydrogenase [Pokkaliibacter sp. CJK22405]|uniref:NAD-dependent succinate-semialdehyde dehydrogenase n=1 Tax=Pokkaliibacter sp. CJK22405 TaxID=3384615 RepID=UPI003985655D
MLNLKKTDLLKTQCLINGEWVDAINGETIEVTNPATDKRICTVPKLGSKETTQAIAAAEKALPAWRAKTAKERSGILRRWFELMNEHADDLALLMTTEQGKSLKEAKGEVSYAASFIEWFAEEGKRIYGDTIPTFANDRRVLVMKEPVGVCAAITPWNFPAAMITRKAGPALASGCTLVVKPASATPLTALAMAVLAEEAGVPAGVLNVITGSSSDIGKTLTDSPIVRKLTFTGSTDVGKALMRASADTVKKVSMELGGNAPFIVFDDADIDAAVEGAIASKFRNSGQTCVCANRLYVQAGVYDAFVSKLKTAVEALKVGEGTEEGVDQGPLINGDAVTKVKEHIEDALGKGGKLITGGKPHALGGNFFQPTVIADATAQMKFAREETFGPLAPVFKFEKDDEVITLANDTEFGLASYFYARDVGRIWKVAEALQSGIVGVNTGAISSEVAPFGGYKESGVGREGSKYGIEDYLNIKYVCLAGL